MPRVNKCTSVQERRGELPHEPTHSFLALLFLAACCFSPSAFKLVQTQ